MKQVFAAVVFLLLSGIADAQQNGRLTGTIVDPSGAPVPNAKVSLLLPEGASALLETTTDSAGIFDFTSVRPDTYKLQVEAANFSRYVQTDVKVEAVRQTTLGDIRMGLGATTQVVEVAGAIEHVTLATAEV